ncbi:MAG: phosphotransferase, partial [Euryarchaeota archaeon]|nr:phosphotransferase [Euryarchaeota archaeon]
MLQLDCDFHIHSRYSAGTSDSMNFENIASQAPLKGLQVVGTGDALHPRWLEAMRALAESSDGVLERDRCKFVATVEVEDAHRVHHLLFLPGIAAAEGLREALKDRAVDLDTDGRPHLRIEGAELVDLVMEAGGFLGPAHAFVPWTSVYKEYDSLKACYGDRLK